MRIYNRLYKLCYEMLHRVSDLDHWRALVNTVINLKVS